jgi:hypothetical protein
MVADTTKLELERVIDYIIQEPLRLDMRHWVLDGDCGTVGCIAGLIVALTVSTQVHPADIFGTAIKILGIGRYQAQDLFYVYYWPRPFREEMVGLDAGSSEYALVTANRLRHFIEWGK